MARAPFGGRHEVLIVALATLLLLPLVGNARAAEPPPDAPPPYPPVPATGTAPGTTAPATAPQAEAQPAPPALAPPPATPAPVAAPHVAPPPGAYPPPPRPWLPRPEMPPPTAPPPSEPGLAVGQLALGSLTTIVAFAALAAVSQSSGEGSAGSFVLLAAPAATGFVVCGLGSRSQHYRGGCTPAVVGAYLGLLSVFPLALVGCQLDGGQNGEGCLGGALLGVALGILVGPAVGATVGWHTFKEPRTEPWTASAPRNTGDDRAPLPTAWMRGDDSPTGRRPQHGAVPVRLSVPLLSLKF